MSKSRETIETAYGLLDNTNLQKVRDGYDTRDLLSRIDKLDEFVRVTRDDDGLRDMLLRLHAMAHTVVNGALMVVSSGQDSLPELATDVKMQLREAVLLFQKWIRSI